MTCLIENQENNHSVEQLARRLSLHYDQTTSQEIVDESLVENYKHLAYYLLANNDGQNPEFDRHGKPSRIFAELKRMYGGDERLAIIAKAYIYTPQFIEKYGDWVSEGKNEPEFYTVEDPQFLEDVEELFPNAGKDSKDAVDLMLQDLLHSQVFGDVEISGYNPAINENSIFDTIQEDCQNWIENKLEEEGIAPEDRKERTRELRRRYYNEKMDFLFDRITNRLLKEWGLTRGEDGLVKMPADLKKEDYARQDGLTIYDIFEFRCNFLNTLNSRRGDVSNIPVLVQMFKDILRGSSTDIITENMLNAYIDLYKDSDLFIKILKASDYLIYDNDGKPSKESVAKGIAAIKQELASNLYDVNKKLSAKGGFSKRLSQFWKFIKHLTRILFCAWKVLNDNLAGRAAVGAVIAIGGTMASLWVIPGLNIAIPILGGIALPSIFKSVNSAINQKWHIKSDTAVAFHSTVRDWIMAFSLNQSLGSFDAEGNFKPGEGVISSVMFEIRHDATEVMLYRILQNINTQIKSARSRVGQQYTTSAQLAELEELKELCEEAIRQKNLTEPFYDRTELETQELNKRYHVQQFVERYAQIAESKLSSSYDYLQQVQYFLQSGDIDMIDAQRLMRIKTDIIGAYSIILPRYILPKSNTYGVDESRAINMQKDLNDVRSLFSSVLKSYVTEYTKKFLGETAYKSLNNDLYKQRLADNMENWFGVQLNNGNLSVFDRNVYAPRTSQSPVVRMIHQKLAEIETNCLAEAGEVGALLEDIRVANRSMFSKDRIIMNPMNKYAERTKDGKFTGNFVSDTNLGQYENDYKEIREILKKKHGIDTLPDGDYLWDDGRDYEYELSYTIIKGGSNHTETIKVKRGSNFDRWQAYNTDLILWQAGAEQDENGNFVLVDGVQPRVHRRYKYQYYLDKTRILGRDGVSTLADINRQIAELYAECETEITYKKNGVEIKRKVPVLSKLPEYKRVRLQGLINKKSQLANQYWFKMDDNGRNIVSIEKKDKIATDQAKKFYLWEQKKHEYYNKTGEKAKSDDALWKATRKYLEDNGATQEELDLFEKTTTQLVPSRILTDLFERENEVEYDTEDESTREYLDLLKLKSQIRRQILSNNQNRTPDLMRLGDWRNPEKVKDLWVALTEIDQALHDLRHGVNGRNKIKATVVSAGEEGLKRFDYIENELVPRLDNNGEEILNSSFKDYLINWLANHDVYFGPNAIELKYDSSNGLAWTSFLKYERVKELTAMGLQTADGRRLFDSSTDLYEQRPVGVFQDSQSDMYDEEFDNNAVEYLQVNKNYSAYDNRAQYNEIKNDKVYQKLLEIMDMAWKNYNGFTRKNRYQMPQRLAPKSSVYGRAFLQGGKTGFRTFKSALEYTFHDLYRFDNRDVEVNNEVITRADGTTVETIPSRWIRKLDDPNMIDTDLVSSVIDFYNESLRFKYRSQLEPVMEAMYFKLTGGYDRSSDAGSNAQAEIVRSEMSRALYGRNMTGFGQNGRITEEDALLAKWSKGFRSLLHKRLMSHNWLSVLKNGYDSFCNLLTAAYTGKQILTQNFFNGLGKLIFDTQNKQFTLGNQLLGLNRSKAVNMTQALMQLNGVNSSVSERFSGQNKSYLRRMLSKSATLEFEFVDYTAKAIITESVYDSYRLMWNPATGKYEFLNENQAEYAYENRKAGYNAWNAASSYTLRNCYYQDKNAGGALKMKDYITIKDINGRDLTLSVIDIIRPQSQISITDDGRSHALENQIRTTIKQMCQTINGMLDEEDKNALAKNYAGALLVSFRGWMISQSSEFYKQGSDFYTWENEGDVGNSKQTIMERLQQKLQINDKRSAGLEDLAYQGQFNFATGTIDKGLHVALTSNIKANFLEYLQMVLVFPEFINIKGQTSKDRHLKRMSQAQFYQLRNFAAATDFFLLTLGLTAMAFSFYNGGDGDDDDPVLQAKSLAFTAALASISERFPQLGMIPFLLGSTDLIKAVTVGVTIFDDAHYLLDAAMNMATYAQNILSQLGIVHEYSEEVGDKDGISKYVEVLSNGSFKGETKAKRDFIKALALFDIDTLPLLLTLDALTDNDIVPEKWRNTKFRDYHLNYRKSTTPNAQKGLRKFYETIIPASMFSDWFGWSESNNGKKNVKNPSTSTSRGGVHTRGTSSGRRGVKVR